MTNSLKKINKVFCVCGASHEVSTLVLSAKIDVCSNCHSFYTGKKRITKELEKTEKFKLKYKGWYKGNKTG